MSKQETDYREEAECDARSPIHDHLDEIIEEAQAGRVLRWVGDIERIDDALRDLPSCEFSLLEAAQVLEELSEWEETDSGLWESLPPREAVACQAHYTYQNAVRAFAEEALKKLGEGLSESLGKIACDDGAECSDAWVRLYLTVMVKLQPDGGYGDPGPTALKALNEGRTDGLKVWLDYLQEEGRGSLVEEVRSLIADYEEALSQAQEEEEVAE